MARFQLVPALIVGFLFFNVSIAAQPYNVKDFGASGEKAQNARTYIQQAIDACFLAGGGTVLLPPGDYRTGTIILKSNVNLHIEAGATIWASLEEEDFDAGFPIYKNNKTGDKQEGLANVLIYARKANNISITGKGMIHGQARRAFEPLKEVDGFIENETENAKLSGVPMERWYKVVPFATMIFIEDCEDIKVQDVRLIESSEWTLHFKWCNRATVHGIFLQSSLESGVNADGIDIDGCTNVTVSDCIIETGDDAIVLKTTTTFGEARPCENIVVTNCILTSTSTALKLGTESHADFRYINFSNCIIRNSNRGLSIVIRDGATVEHVQFANIQIECNRKPFFWWGDGDPIWLVVKKRNPDSKIGKIRDVRFTNIVARGQGTSKIEGYEGEPLRRISLEHVSLVLEAESALDKRSTDILRVDRCEGLEMNHIDLKWDPVRGTETNWRHALQMQEVRGGKIGDISCTNTPSGGNMAVIYLRDVTDLLADDISTENQNGSSVRIEGAASGNILLGRINGKSLNRDQVSIGSECTSAVQFGK